MVVGILKNKEQENQTPHVDIDHNSSKEDVHKFRQQVYENTLLNAKLTDNKQRRESSNEFEGETADGHHFKVPKDVLQMKLESSDNLVWNKQNLDENEILKQKYQDIHIDEPKTPYQGAADLEGEYYKVDDDLDDFSLGEAAVEVEEPEEEEKPKKSFAEMRKEHYKLGNALKK